MPKKKMPKKCVISVCKNRSANTTNMCGYISQCVSVCVCECISSIGCCRGRTCQAKSAVEKRSPGLCVDAF